MSCSRRRALAALLLVPLAGCGFRPLYAERSSLGYDPALAAIQVQPAPDRVGQILTQSLREQLNPRGAHLPTRYVLTVAVSVVRSDLGIRRDNTSTRGELTFTVSLTLSAVGGGASVYKDSIRSLTAFNLPDDAYAASVAEQNAREEAADQLGREIADRLAVFLRRHGTEGA
jgi:LPS-assembly lipoprotein